MAVLANENKTHFKSGGQFSFIEVSGAINSVLNFFTEYILATGAHYPNALQQLHTFWRLETEEDL